MILVLNDNDRRWLSALVWSIGFNLLLLALMAWLHYVARPHENIPAIAIKFIPSAELQVAKPAPPAPAPKKRTLPQAPRATTPASEPIEELPPVEPPAPAPDYDVQPLHRVTRIPQFLRRIEPAYPEGERVAGHEATVLVEIVIDTRGRVLEASIVKSGGAEFDSAVLDALEQSLFTPGYIEDRAVVVRLQIPFSFRLR